MRNTQRKARLRQRPRQGRLFNWRWALCPHHSCGHLDRYHVSRFHRLRDRDCRRCGRKLGRGANLAARPYVRSRAKVDRLARQMGVGSTP